MARIRTIKPDFFRHEELQDLAKKHGLEIMLVFIGIWTQCDKEGNFLLNHRQLSLDILPFLKIDMEMVLDVLGRHKYILGYTKDGKEYGHIPTFKKHQMIFGSERKYTAKFPQFEGISEDVQGQSLGRPRTQDLMDKRNNGIKEESPESSGLVPPLVNQKKKKEFADDSNEMKAAKYFWAHVKTWAPSTKEPSPASFQKWAKDFDAIMRIDGRTKDEIKDLLACINDQKESPKGFSWRKNILSPATLRERWNEGKLDGLKQEPEKERSIYDIIPNLRMPKENGEYA